ncbi:BamA/TamA family outer membrane protein [uncultured Draconibacterium sp.]|uniref:BamA/TamA family outer membrane protein n=1 Tax=uncultured Draconibacterium sp. TaxID=1573823 RepID=UPI002AA6DEB6|nr:BamA/TamA family outer membrane protein [uncultured Draconibacterium sp.]
MKKHIILLLLLQLCNFTFAIEKQDSLKKVSYAAIPIIDYDKTFGLSGGALVQAFYKLNQNDTISPSSSTGIFGIYSTNNTFFTAAFQQMYFNEDRWRVMMAGGFGNINFQYWQEIPVSEGVFIGFNTKATFTLLRVERKIFDQLYIGVNGIYSKAKTGYDLPDWVPDSLKSEKVNMHNIGYQLNYDKREHQLNPYGGYNIEFKHAVYSEWLNSSSNFNNFEFTYNHYFKIKNEKNILATRFKADISTGDVPFQGQNVVGQDDIRGYTSGKYRNNQVYAIQAEYRWRFYKKLGMVGFMGLATAVDSFSEIPDHELLPGIGVGFRFMMIEKERVNIGIDIAQGKDDWGLYFRIGESFGR